MVKEFLSQANVEYTEKRVDQDREAYEEFMKLGMSGVPVTKIGEEVVIGFDRNRLSQLLGLS